MRVFFKFFMIVFLLAQSNFYAQSIELKIDNLIETKFEADNPGAVFLVAKEGKPIYRKAFGKANLEMNIAMQPEFVFEIGSMTKQFTAVAIALLEEQGKLNFQDEIIKFIPDYPTQGNKITIHHLLTHTSGIKDFTKMKELRKISKNNLSPKELVDFFKNEPMDFNSGEQFKYNNSGYIILGYIIEIVSGQSYEDFIQKNIFDKLVMIATYYASHEKVIKNRVSGYHNREGYVNNDYISFTLPYASGSIMSTVDDMLKWQNAMDTNKLVNSKTKQKIFTNYKLNNGEEINYGYGWHIKEISKSISLEHGGSIFGFKSMGVYLPKEKIYVIGFSNCDCNSPTQLTKDIATLFVDE
ncbi:beta-lactamase family protein [Flavobacterium jejuense]|uniref:Beta-lactamase family protein n=1 Tax=Flavobacterium jejuense TaxID=1544455 RepID=A0ABX0IRT1_9FLAO|nr:serine hydrolase domain-containing protein [Flavobacterium jejuense]NHN26408.1 beta-lactamase family protein [Flavobacterium jejuense]